MDELTGQEREHKMNVGAVIFILGAKRRMIEVA
jgi:hypothetical protein